MPKMCAKFFRLLVILFCMSAAFACSKKSVPVQPGFGAGGSGSYSGGMGPGSGGGFGGDDARWRELGLNSEAERQQFLESAKDFENDDIYFDYDSYMLSPPAKKILDDKVEFLKRYSKVKINIEGHCDERGTNEYNLALGERRANSAMQYLVNSGVGEQRVTIVSYGEERPVATGHDESSWAKNRRAHFVLIY